MDDHHLDPALPDAPRLDPARQWRLLAIGAAAIVLIVTVVAVLSGWLASPPPEPPPLPPGTFRPTASQLQALSLMKVGDGGLDEVTAATGTIAADGDSSTPVIMPYSGQVVKVLVDAGQIVARGQPLLMVRTGDFVDARNALFAANATLATARAQLSNAQRNAQRQKALYETAGGALKDWQQSQTDLAAAQAQVRTAEAAVGATRDKLAIFGKSPEEIHRVESAREVSGIHEVTALHAPLGGLIAARDVSPGQYLGAGGDHAVFTITDPGKVWLLAQLAESEAGAVHLGDTVTVTTPAYPGRTFTATVDLVGAALDPTTHRLPVRATIANPDGALKPQMFASFAIHHPHGAVSVAVPVAAVIHEGDKARVWVLRRDGLLAARTVTTGAEAEGKVEITSGLTPGETIVTAGAIFVNEAGLGE